MKGRVNCFVPEANGIVLIFAGYLPLIAFSDFFPIFECVKYGLLGELIITHFGVGISGKYQSASPRRVPAD